MLATVQERHTAWLAQPPAAGAPEHERLKWWRQASAKLSIDQLAERLSIAPQDVIRLERGDNPWPEHPAEDVYRDYREMCAMCASGSTQE